MDVTEKLRDPVGNWGPVEGTFVPRTGYALHVHGYR